MTIDIIFPTLNNLEFTKDTLNSFFKYHRGKDLRLIVIDGKSTDGTLDFLKENKEKFSIEKIIVEERRGCGLAYNLALRECNSDFVLLMPNDLLFTQECLTPLIAVLEKESKVAIVGSKLLYPSGQIQHAGMVFGENFEPYHIGRFDPGSLYTTYREYPCITLTFGAFRRKIVPFFDEKYQYNYEDVDFCLKMIVKDYKVVYVPESILHHFESATTVKVPGFWEMRKDAASRFHKLWDNYLLEEISRDREFWTKGRSYEVGK